MSEDHPTFPEKIQGLDELVLQLQADLWNNRHFKVIDEYFADDITHSSPGLITAGKDELKSKFFVPLFAAFPDLKWVSLEVISSPSSICTRWTLSGTFTQKYLGVAPNGNKISWQGVSITHIRDGKISSIRSVFDRTSFTQALTAPSNK